MLANVVLIIFWICFGFIVVRGRTLGSEGGASDRASRLKCKSPASNGPVPTRDILDLFWIYIMFLLASTTILFGNSAPRERIGEIT